MRLLNADGSRSEVSGNGCAAWPPGLRRSAAARTAPIDDRDRRRARNGSSCSRTRAAATRSGRRWEQPEQIALARIDVGGRTVEAVTLRVGNPQCVVLGEVTEERLHTLASALAVHPHFPEGTNVELATVEAPGSRPDPDLGARRRADRGVRHRRVRGGGGGDPLRRRRARRAGRLARRRAARRVDRRRALPDRLGGTRSPNATWLARTRDDA